MSKENEDATFKVIISTFVLGICIALLLTNIELSHKVTEKDFKLSELSEGVGYQICTSQIEAPFFICDDKNNELYHVGFQTNNETTQVQIDKWVAECPDTKIIEGYYCTVNTLEIRGTKKS